LIDEISRIGNNPETTDIPEQIAKIISRNIGDIWKNFGNIEITEWAHFPQRQR
jgi:hypothetical protein